MNYQQAFEIATKLKEQLAPHCHRIEIAGSIRRKKPEVKDIELVAIPKPYQTGLFEDGIAAIVNQWQKVKGELEYGKTKYTQRILLEGIKLDLFFAEPGNWGLIYAMRTGSADYSHKVLGRAWVSRGYHSHEGYLHIGHKRYETPEEADLLTRIGVAWCEPELRNI